MKELGQEQDRLNRLMDEMLGEEKTDCPEKREKRRKNRNDLER